MSVLGLLNENMKSIHHRTYEEFVESFLVYTFHDYIISPASYCLAIMLLSSIYHRIIIVALERLQLRQINSKPGLVKI